MRQRARAGGGQNKVDAQHEKGKLTARERIELLCDQDSFVEHQRYVQGRSTAFGMAEKRFPGDGVVAGTGTVAGRQVFVCAQDFTVLGGSLGEMQALRIAECQEQALRMRCPFIQINDSGGARIQEGVLSLEGYARIFHNNTNASGVIPQFSVILGPCAGGAVYSPAITDFVSMVDGVSNMYITGPGVIQTVTGEEISHEELGGAGAHAQRSGVAHFRFSSEEACFEHLRGLLSYLPGDNESPPPAADPSDDPDRETPELLEIIPEDAKQTYDVHDVVSAVFDGDSFLEVHASFAPNIVVGFAKLAGRTVGVFANQPKVYAASLNIDSSDKAARFLRFCDAFNVPIVSLVDVPGFLPGVDQEHHGIIRHGAKILYAIAEATVPKLSLILRKAYGGAYIAMASKHLGYDRVLALPNAEIAVMGPEGAANIIFKREIDSAEDPDAARTQKIAEFRSEVTNPFVAAGYGFVDDVVAPENARRELVRALLINASKQQERPRRKHGNIPL
jgi:acetyl-CoA carboxylase carboxyltransferase component